jgi:hypothetical protein
VRRVLGEDGHPMSEMTYSDFKKIDSRFVEDVLALHALIMNIGSRCIQLLVEPRRFQFWLRSSIEEVIAIEKIG